jgi:thioredoxin reductase
MEHVRHKYIILGAGPGGLQMGYFLHRQRRDYLILERNQTAGSFFETQPRHRKLLSINKRYNYFAEDEFNLRHDWNSLLSDDPEMRFTNYSEDLFPDASELHTYLQAYASRFDLNIVFGRTVARVSRDGDDDFVITDVDGNTYRCEILLSALGTVGPNIPCDIDGIEFAESYEEHELDLERYRNKRVGIIGQGNSAFETADHLAGTAATVHILAKRPVKFAWQTHHVGDVRAINNNLFDMYQLKSLHAVLTPTLTAIRQLPGGTLETSHHYDYPNAKPPGSLMLTREYDYLIRCTGWKWSADEIFSENVQPTTHSGGKYLALSSSWESENVPDLFFIGGAMGSSDRKSTSAFIHGYRYNIRTLHHLLEERYDDTEYPRTVLDPFDWDAFLDWMYTRFSTSDALFQVFGVLCDVLVVAPDHSRAYVMKELPIDYVREQDFGDHHLLILSLEFGFEKFDEPAHTFFGPSDPTNTACAAFLHPVIRHRRGGEVSEFHFGDSLLARWDRPHSTGGAVASYHYQFQVWADEKMQLGLELPEAAEGGAYRLWSADEIETWESRTQQSESGAPCTRPF